MHAVVKNGLVWAKVWCVSMFCRHNLGSWECPFLSAMCRWIMSIDVLDYPSFSYSAGSSVGLLSLQIAKHAFLSPETVKHVFKIMLLMCWLCLLNIWSGVDQHL